MHLDSLTLIVIGTLSIVLCGVFLLVAWTQMQRAPALLWWATANLAYPASTAVAMLGVLNFRDDVIVVGTLLSNAAPALIWAGARVFARGKAPVPVLLCTIGAATGGTVLAYAMKGVVPASTVSFATWVAFLAAAAAELWRGRAERLPARWPLVALFLVHAIVYCGGIVDLATGTLYDGSGAPPINSWFGIIYFEGIIYSMGTAIFMSLMCKEREERKHIAAAGIDSLTGAANRGTFFERAARLLARYQHQQTPLSVIVFDLDRFKTINDTRGHAVGDQVLKIFADAVRSVLRPTDLFGRHGGEEFAVVLPGATPDTAYVIAERVRNAFATAVRRADGPAVAATVSAGVAAAVPGATFEQAMIAADTAMYRAKEHGRNRVERFQPGIDLIGSDRGASGVTRVA